MRICDVEDVDVVAHTGAVGRRIVGAENIDGGNRSGGGIQHARNQMRFRAMSLTAFGGSAGGVEVAQRGAVQSSVGAVIGENLFEEQFGLAVRIDGSFAMVLGNRDGFGFAIGGSGRRKNELFDAVASD